MRGARWPRVALRALALATAAMAAAVLGAVIAGGSPPSVERSPAAQRPLPRAVQPAFVPGAPAPLGDTRHLARWAPVLRPVLARAAPRAAAPPVAGLDTRTPEGSANLVAVLGRREEGAGRVWVRVRLPVLPNGTTGWVPRAALGGYGTVDTRLDVDLRHFRATLFRAGRPVFSADVGVGRPQWPTPRGTFYVRNKLTRYRSPAYGPVAFGTSARSPTLTDWPAGGFVGIHGTDRPDLLPGRVSHGCIRLRNEDILALARLMPVGTPLVVH
jgi:lipoprotein-anchoring transpeptidase ErfK/SrfK